ncbi:MOSC domain-containing protein [Kitasatospora sp. NPDC058063]|uniref:MOSC domain-containing protein n=1 Tax=unclassified Kitasatospora TaxID=2633591 RepID=UPI0036DA397D
MATVTELRYYPVKGCAGVTAAQAELTRAGLAHDREFMVVDEEGVFRSQRRDPVLATVRPAVTRDGRSLTLTASGMEPLSVTVDTEGPRREVRLFHLPFLGIDQGKEAADWLSEVLGSRGRLVRVPPEHDRVTTGLTPGTSAYADSCAVLLVSHSSLEHFNGLSGELSDTRPVPMDRFRANLVVDGWTEPHTEDLARRIEVGGAELGYAKLAIRCAVTTLDQSSGTKTGPEPLRTLARYRRATAGGVAFGSKFAVLRPGTLRVGDELTVGAWGPFEL